MIELKQVSKNYTLGEETIHALDEVDLHIAAGEFVALVGPSGSGKSTCMNVLGLLDAIDSGTYLLNGEDVGHFSNRYLAELRNKNIGFVFQSFNLLNTMTAFENVMLPLLYRGMKKKQARRLVSEYFERLDLAGRESHMPSQLSGGQQQRVAIARALVGSPEIVLADEPTGALDTQTGEEIMQVFTELNAEGQTIVLITHNPELAARAGRVVSIVNGRLQEKAVGWL